MSVSSSNVGLISASISRSTKQELAIAVNTGRVAARRWRAGTPQFGLTTQLHIVSCATGVSLVADQILTPRPTTDEWSQRPGTAPRFTGSLCCGLFS